MLEVLGLQLPASLKALGYNKIIQQSQNAVKTMKYPKQMNSDKLSANQEIIDERQQNSLNKVVNKVGIEVQDSYAYPKYSDKTWRASANTIHHFWCIIQLRYQDSQQLRHLSTMLSDPAHKEHNVMNRYRESVYGLPVFA